MLTGSTWDTQRNVLAESDELIGEKVGFASYSSLV